MWSKILLLLPLGLTACQSSEMSCSNPDGVAVVKDLVRSTTEKNIISALKDQNIHNADQSSVRASLALIKIDLSDFRLEKKDPNSEKVYCAATIELSVPPERLNGIQQALGKLVSKETTLSGFAMASDFEQKANKFTSQVGYSLQPTEDRKVVYAEIDRTSAPVQFFDQLVIADMLGSMNHSTNKIKDLSALNKISETQSVQKNFSSDASSENPKDISENEAPGDMGVSFANSPGDGFLSLRSAPSIQEGKRLMKIPHGSQVGVVTCEGYPDTVDKHEGDWCLVNYDGKFGYVFSYYLTD